MTRARRRKLPFGWIISVMLMVFGMLIAMVYVTTEVEARIPQMEITLNDDTTLEILNSGLKTTKYYDNSVKITDGFEVQEFGDVEVKGRGNATWKRLKKPYQIKFAEKVDLFGLGKARKWVLLANSYDQSHLRTDATFLLKQWLGMGYLDRGEFVELSVDGRYNGLYYLTRKVEIGKNAVDLRDPMGILVELDNLYYAAEEHWTRTRSGDFLVAKDAVAEDNVELALADFARDFEILEEAAEAGDYATVTEVADVESLAKYFLLNELIANQDAYATSQYFYKDGEGDKIHAGPAWDFDGAFGNAYWGDYEDTSRFYSPEQWLERRVMALGGEFYNGSTGEVELTAGDNQTSKLMYNLAEIPEFWGLVTEIWRENLAGRGEELARYVEMRADEIREAAARDAARWKIWEFDTEVKQVAEWIRTRFKFLDETIFAPTEVEDMKGARPEVPITGVDDAETPNDGVIEVEGAKEAPSKVPTTEVNDYSKNNPA